MQTIAGEIELLIAHQPFIEDGLARGIINVSALAREFQPILAERLDREVSESAVMMALKRAVPAVTARRSTIKPLLADMGDLTVRSNLVEFTYRRSPETLSRQAALLDRLQSMGNQFITFTQGVLETTIITSAGLAPQVERAFAGEQLVARMDDLAAIVIRLPDASVEVAGVHYTLLKQFAWHDINLIEVVSTYSELTLVVDRHDVDRGFSVLMDFLG
jgi:hypothetical protein